MNQATHIICTVDAALLTLDEEGLKVALLRRAHEPYSGVAALPGGFIHTGDSDAHEAAWRVLKEKTGIEVPYLEQLATFSGPARDPRGWSVSIAYYALVPPGLLEQAGDRALAMVGVDRLPHLPFDHATIIGTAVARLRSKSQYSSLPCHLAGATFTLPQLKRVYEALMGEPINNVSFRRKIEEMAMLEPVDAVAPSGAAHRPAQFYRLKAQFRATPRLLRRGL